MGLVRTLQAAAKHLGLALCVGWALIGIAATVALLLGAAVTEMQVVLIAAGVLVAGLALSRAVQAAPVVQRGRHWTDLLAVPALAAAAVYAAKLLERARVDAITEWDVWAAWLPKAQSIVYFGGLDTAPGGYLSLGQTHYPPLSPLQDAIAFRFMNEVDPLLLPLQHTIFALAVFWALGALLSGPVSPAIVWPAVLMLMLPRDVSYLVGSSLGDEPVALLFPLAGIAALLWLHNEDRRLACLAALFLAAAALAKNEGLLLGVVLAAGLALGCGRAVRWRWRPIAAIAAAPILAQIPWKVWLAANEAELAPDYSLLDLARPQYLLDRLDRLEFTLRELPGYLLDPKAWNFLVPLFLLAAAVAIRKVPGIAIAAASTAAMAFVGLAVVYWIGRQEVEWWIDTSARRVVASIVMFCGASFPLLIGSALRTRVRRRPAAATDAAGAATSRPM